LRIREHAPLLDHGEEGLGLALADTEREISRILLRVLECAFPLDFR
jgi:hypothetical protein